MDSPTPLAVDSGAACNNACHGCARPASSSSAPASTVPLRWPAHATRLVLHGGEPTLHPGFLAALSEARRAGATVAVETNARVFAVPGRATQAARAGMSLATVTLWGAREASHDFLAGSAGSFRQAVAGTTQLRVAGVAVTARLVVTRSTLAELGSMATLALGLGAHAVRLSFARMEPRPPGFEAPPRLPVVEDPGDAKGPLHVDLSTPAGDRGGYDERREWLVPRYRLAAEPLAAAVRAVARMGRSVLVDGVPLCLLPPGATLAAGGPSCFAPSAASSSDGYAEACTGCTARHRCPGVPRGYLARFGDEELRPVP